MAVWSAHLSDNWASCIVYNSCKCSFCLVVLPHYCLIVLLFVPVSVNYMMMMMAIMMALMFISVKAG